MPLRKKMVKAVVYIIDNIINGWNIIYDINQTVGAYTMPAIRFLSFCFVYSIVPFFVAFLTILIAHFFMDIDIFQCVKVNVHSWNHATIMIPNVTLVFTLMIELFTIFAMQFVLITWMESRNTNSQILPQWDILLVNKIDILHHNAMIETRKFIVKLYQNLYVTLHYVIYLACLQNSIMFV